MVVVSSESRDDSDGLASASTGGLARAGVAGSEGDEGAGEVGREETGTPRISARAAGD